MVHRFNVRVYYEDTDFGGIVYYANYLKFIERARTEMIRDAGVDQVALKADGGVVLAVRSLQADYLAAARMDDLLEVRTEVARATPVRAVLRQEVWRGEALIFTAEVTLVALGAGGRATRLPRAVRAVLGGGPGGT